MYVPRYRELYVVALAAGVAWLVGSTLWREFRRRRSERREDEAACGRCGYVIAPGSSTRCPECGQDVRLVGLVTRDTSRLLPAGPVYALGVLLALLAGNWAGGLVAQAQPFGRRWEAEYWVHFDQPGGLIGVFGNREFIIVWAYGKGRYWRQPPRTVAVRSTGGMLSLVTDGGSRCDLEVLASDGTTQHSSGPFGPEMVRRFIRGAGGDPDDEEGRRATAEVEQRVRFLAAASFPSSLDEEKVREALPGFVVRYRLEDWVERAFVQLTWLVLVPAVIRGVWRYRGRWYEAAAALNGKVVERLGLVPAAA